MTPTSRSFATIALLPLCLLLLLVKSTEASLPFNVSYPRQCTPLNITWTPTSKGYPYSVYIMSVGGTIQSYTVPSSYQPNADQVTFQLNLPPPSSFFASFIVAISDAQGNGNSSRVLPIQTDGDSNSNCEPWAGTAAFTYAGDSQVGQDTDRVQCGNVRYYPVSPPFRGTRPFSITWVPLGAQPISISIPQSATQNDSFFVYTSPVPFASGTQVYQFLSDATGGGSGGGSAVYTVTSSSDTSCLASGYTLANQITDRTMPLGTSTATFQNLAGAVDASSVTGDGNNTGKKSTGGLVGGIIGAVIGVGAILLLVAIFLIYRRRQKRKWEAARKEAPQFVDLIGDEDDRDHGGLGARAGRRGVSQTYHVSPFTYQSAASHSPNEMTNEVMEMNMGSTHNLINSAGGGGGGSPRPGSMNTANSYNDNASLRYPPTASSNHLAPSMASMPYYNRSEGDYVTSPTHSSANNSFNRTPNNGSYVLRTRNESNPSTHTQQAPPIPNKAALFGEGAEAEPTSTSRRLLQHADAGPVLPPSTDVEELPPSYGQWTASQQQEQQHQQAQNQSERRRQPSRFNQVTSEVTPADPRRDGGGELW